MKNVIEEFEEICFRHQMDSQGEELTVTKQQVLDLIAMSIVAHQSSK
jgi:hypothetical protein